MNAQHLPPFMLRAIQYKEQDVNVKARENTPSISKLPFGAAPAKDAGFFFILRSVKFYPELSDLFRNSQKFISRLLYDMLGVL